MAFAASGPATAQSSYAQPVVQPVPPPALGELNAALKDLSRDPRNVYSLLRAGWASLGLDDTEAALGFFRRAAAIQPQNGEVKAGLASASLRQNDPVAAVRLFGEAEAAGAPMARYASDRGLAFDLVGDNTRAQQYYRQALAVRYDTEVARRLALSQAIAGDQSGAEATLLPLLQARDLASFRTRAFALAILGKGEEAVTIAQTMLPAQISGRLAPYLRYMPRLTRAQQAAAANLGQFPPASEIGRDSPQIAALSAAATPQVAAASADSRLVPKGEPLGRKDRKSTSNRKTDTAPAKAKPKVGKGGGDISVTYSPITQASPPPQVPVPQAGPPVQRVAAAVQPTELPAQSSPSAFLGTPQQSQDAAPQATLPTQRVAAAVQAPPSPLAAGAPVLIASIDPEPSSAPSRAPVEQVAAPPPPVSTAAPQPKATQSLAEAFADFATLPASKPAAPVRQATRPETPKVDQAKAKAKAKPKPPAQPKRYWAQVATGRDVKALAFDWRRLQKEGGALLAKRDAYTARWGATRRLLAGPYKTEAEADKAVSALKKKGIDAFEFTSDEGEEVTPLK